MNFKNKKRLSGRNVGRFIDLKLRKKYPNGIDECEEAAILDIIKWMYDLRTHRFLMGDRTRYFYKIRNISLKSFASLYLPKYKKPGDDIPMALFEPHVIQRTQLSPKFEDAVDSTLWENLMAFELIIEMTSATTDGMMNVLADISRFDRETEKGVGIYDGNTKTHIATSFINTPDNKMITIGKKEKERASELLRSRSLNCEHFIYDILETIIEQPIGTFFNYNWFLQFGFNEALEVLENSSIDIHVTHASPNEVVHIYDTLGVNGVPQSDLMLLNSQFQAIFSDDIYAQFGKDIIYQLLNNYKRTSEPVYVNKAVDFYGNVKSELRENYGGRDLYYLNMLPLYFFNLKTGKFDYDRVPTLDDKYFDLLWGVDRKGKLTYIGKCFDYIYHLKNDTRKAEVIDEWRDIIFDLRYLASVMSDNANDFSKMKHSDNHSIARKIKDYFNKKYSDKHSLSRSNINKLYNFDHDGSSPITSIMLNVYAFIRRTSSITIDSADDIFNLVIKYYKKHYFDFLIDPQNTEDSLEDKLKNEWKNSNPKKSLPGIIDTLYDISGNLKSIGSDGILHIHYQFFKDVLSPKIQNDDIFKSAKSQQTVKKNLLRTLSEESINYEDYPLIMTKHGEVGICYDVNHDNYLNIGHSKMRKNGGLVHVETDNIDGLQYGFLMENKKANQIVEKSMDKDYVLWWVYTIRYNNHLYNSYLQELTSSDVNQYIKRMARDGGKFYYTHDIETKDVSDFEKKYLKFKNLEFLRNNLEKIVSFMRGVEWDESPQYDEIDYRLIESSVA